ncbi:MAG TPA: bifunctional diaminohydroxyphosphoribosylaminopyrimidine deaminase/5-amino-6-(5-phosphoribosylamino)uracil reductase RibD [Verrucomicrobiae bacterium]|nr:bifunctional diaminohydroxyphosphoribosylaminopyrimidine deaminase/5-amino-6-(5-phosphoribosylamino)uracil reductase RibD [Verrucomicrobiae bacterium]
MIETALPPHPAPEDPMAEALRLARLGDHRTSPNPMVGAVVVAGGRLVGSGYHERWGAAHAEVRALTDAGELARGSTLHVTLEPCSHHGQTGPCVERILAAGVARVEVATLDPNPVVNGRGVSALRRAGVAVRVGCHAEEARELISAFAVWVTTGRPQVTLKFAMSLDGKLATTGGESRWITGPESRRRAHLLRHQHDAVLVGSGTVLADDPELSTRLERPARQPWRVVADGRLRTPASAKVLRGGGRPTLVATSADAPRDARAALEAAGAELIELTAIDGHLDLRELARHLGAGGCTSLLVEGGSTLLGSCLAQGLVDRVAAFVAPVLVGGVGAPGAIGGAGVGQLADAVRLRRFTAEALGADLLLSGAI